MTAVIQADSFIETGGCNGPRYNRNTPSRETPGILMTEIQNKYITEFELPYRNIERYIKEIGNNWNRLDDKQRSLIKTSFQNMGLSEKMGLESFSGSVPPGSLVCNCTKERGCTCKEKFGNEETPISIPPSMPNPIDPNISNFINYLSSGPKSNTNKFMNTLWNTTPEQKLQLGLTSEQLVSIRDSMYEWSVDNTYILHSNWRSGIVLFFFILIIIILIIVAATSGNGGSGDSSINSFGRSLFGRRRH